MEPYRDYAVKVINNQTLDVYFKTEPSPVKKVSFTVKEDTHSLAGEELERDYTFEFTEWESDFQLDKLIVWESLEFEVNDDSALDLSQLSKPYLAGAEYYKVAGIWLTEFTFNFNYPVNLAAGLSILSKIELVPDDERIGNVPSLVEVGISASDYDQTWDGMEYGTLDSPYRYLLKIPGGIEGISDGNGHYLKEDMTLMLDVIDYDELLGLLDG
jgi:hypothetical protein